MKAILFTCRNTQYKVKRNGDLLQVNNTYNEWDKSWRLYGVSYHPWAIHIKHTLKEIWDNPKLLIGGLIHDINNRTHRKWGGLYNGKLPRVTSAYKTTI